MGIMGEALAQSQGGGQWAKFENVGDIIEGEIVSLVMRQATDFTTKLPAMSNAGKPKMQLVVGLRMQGQITEDDDLVRLVDVNLWGIQRDALDAAVKQFGRDADVGDRMMVKYLGKQKPAYTSALAHAYAYRFVEGVAVPAPTPLDSWAEAPLRSDDTPF